MSKVAKDALGLASVVAAAALFFGLHSWMFVN